MILRKLPHRDIQRVPVHINYRLYGSLPRAEAERLSARRKQALIELEETLKDLPPHLAEAKRRHAVHRINAYYELAIDEVLDQLSIKSNYHLSDPRAQREVVESWLKLESMGRVKIHAVCVMGNHVHVVCAHPGTFDAPVKTGELLCAHKKYTAREINKLIGRSGTFWDGDYFDRDVRSGKFEKVIWYVLNNPVKVGLVKHWREWSGTYLAEALKPSFP